MSTNHERRSRLMGFKIKEQSWGLEDLKKRNRIAQEELMQADKALGEIEAAIEAAEKSLRQVYEEHPLLDLEAIEAARKFLSEQQGLRVHRSREQQRAAQRVEQAETQLRQAALYVKALEQAKAASDSEISRVRENKLAEHLTELWCQRYGRNP